MMDNFNNLQKKIQSALELQRGKQAATSGVDKAKKLGLFIQACMTTLGQSHDDFGDALKIEPELATAILDGTLPIDEIDDEILSDIAAFLEHEPNVLRLLLGREIQATRNNQDAFT